MTARGGNLGSGPTERATAAPRRRQGAARTGRLSVVSTDRVVSVWSNQCASRGDTWTVTIYSRTALTRWDS